MTANPPVDEVAQEVLQRRYLQQDETGQVIETPDELFRRVATNLAQAETAFSGDQQAVEEAFYRVMRNREWLPNSPTLMNAGTELQQLAACFVLPIEDSLASIFDTVKHTALIHQSGGGTGFAFSRLRPQGDIVELLGRYLVRDVLFEKIGMWDWEIVRRPLAMHHSVLPRAVVVPDETVRRHFIGRAVFVEDIFGDSPVLSGQSPTISSAVSFDESNVPMGCDPH